MTLAQFLIRAQPLVKKGKETTILKYFCIFAKLYARPHR